MYKELFRGTILVGAIHIHLSSPASALVRIPQSTQINSTSSILSFKL